VDQKLVHSLSLFDCIQWLVSFNLLVLYLIVCVHNDVFYYPFDLRSVWLILSVNGILKLLFFVLVFVSFLKLPLIIHHF
jgi:hypothetical protein